MSRSRVASGDAGFTLIEVMVAAAVLLIGVLGVMTMLTESSSVTASNAAREQGIALERELVEAVRGIPYEQITNDSIVSQVQASDDNLVDSTPSQAGWQIRRRGVTYTVAMGACIVDDPSDGSGVHGTGDYCRTGTGSTTPAQCATYLGLTGSIQGAGVLGSGSASVGDCGIDLNLDGTVDNLVDATGTAAICIITCPAGVTVDTNPNDYKRVVVLVRWDRGLGRRYALQSTTIPNPGEAAGPSVSQLTTSLTGTITAAVSIPFSVTTNYVPSSVSWFVDGTPQGPAVGSSTSWSFTWALGAPGLLSPSSGEVLDGSYLVSAKAYDSFGVSGAGRAWTVVLNRRVPYAPNNFEGGRNGSVVDFEWSANRERDIQGYRVYRQPVLGSAILVCSLTSQTSCQDTSPPSSATLTYYVVAVDKDNSGNLREGDQSLPAVVTLLNNPPSPPTGLAASTSGGNTVLAWSASPGDPDLGDHVDFYRIYRDGTTFADRYDRTQDGSQLTFTDTHTAGTTHTYWITAVDTQLAESTKLGPVTR